MDNFNIHNEVYLFELKQERDTLLKELSGKYCENARVKELLIKTLIIEINRIKTL